MIQREQLRAVFDASVTAVSPETCVLRHLERRGDQLRVGDEFWDLQSIRRLLVLGAGKASLRMAAATRQVIGDVIDGGVIVSNVAGLVPGFDVIVGDHPVPSGASVAAGEALLNHLGDLGEGDRFLFLLSGGASALCELPMASLTLADLQETTRMLLASGAAIGELNTIRKHLSQVKGGRLGSIARAAGAVLVLSDVIGDDLSSVASGPFYADVTTYGDCLRIIDRYSLAGSIPPAVMALLRSGASGSLPETPDKPWPRVTHHLVGSNQLALAAGAEQVARLGYTPVVESEPLQGEARDVGRHVIEQVLLAAPSASPTFHLFGGETTVTVRGRGRGGRNQELALAALLELRGRPDVSLLAAGTDGVGV